MFSIAQHSLILQLHSENTDIVLSLNLEMHRPEHIRYWKLNKKQSINLEIHKIYCNSRSKFLGKKCT